MGMPQLDFRTFPPQLFWLAVSFFVLYLLMRWLALPRVGAVIAARRQRLDDDLARAATIRAQAEAAAAAYAETMAKARAEAQATIRESAERAAAEATARQQELAAALAQQLAAAERQIAAAKASALTEVRGIAVEVAASLAAKLIGSPLDEGRVAAAVDRAVAERPA
jgi:F-type H+-transporting ATPase subunit b